MTLVHDLSLILVFFPIRHRIWVSGGGGGRTSCGGIHNIGCAMNDDVYLYCVFGVSDFTVLQCLQPYLVAIASLSVFI
jgi:hypothetical protein